MKRCPTCKSLYSDDTLAYCLQDGATLVAQTEQQSPPVNPNATWLLPENALTARDIPLAEAILPKGKPTEQMPPAAATAGRRDPDTARADLVSRPSPKTSHPLMVAGVTAIIILLLVLVGIGIALLVRRAGNNVNANPQANGNAAVQTPARNPTPDANTGKTSPAVTVTNQSGSLQITATASSTRDPLRSYTYQPSQLIDGSLQTAWIEGVPGAGVGEWIRCDFDREVRLKRILLTPGYFKDPSIWKQNNRLAAAILYFSDGSSRRYHFPDQMREQTLDTGGVRTRFVRLVIEETYPGSVDNEDTAISQMSFVWEP